MSDPEPDPGPSSQPQQDQVEQIVPGKWMDAGPPVMPTGCPSGLQYLSLLDKLLFYQTEPVVVGNRSGMNHYLVRNCKQELVFEVTEETGGCSKICCRSAGTFVYHVTDRANQEIMRISHAYKCGIGCCWCATADCVGDEVIVEAPVGQVIGYVRQTPSCMKLTLDIKNENRETVFKTGGWVCFCGLSTEQFVDYVYADMAVQDQALKNIV